MVPPTTWVEVRLLVANMLEVLACPSQRRQHAGYWCRPHYRMRLGCQVAVLDPHRRVAKDQQCLNCGYSATQSYFLQQTKSLWVFKGRIQSGAGRVAELGLDRARKLPTLLLKRIVVDLRGRNSAGGFEQDQRFRRANGRTRKVSQLESAGR